MPDWWTKRGYFKLLEPSELDLDTPEACLGYVRKVAFELASMEIGYEGWRQQADPSDEATLVMMRKRMDSLIDHTADAVYEALRRLASLTEA
jgi:hypothetical protein